MKRASRDDEEELEPIVDDLVVVALYATTRPSIPATADHKDEDEISLNETSSTNDKEDKEETPSDDNDSEVDLAEELARMEQLDEGEDDDTTSQPPTTTNEMNAYQVSTKQWEAALSLQIGVEPNEQRHVSQSNFSIAGRIQHYLADERILVVRSEQTPLDEGSVLWILKDTVYVPVGKVFEVFGPVNQPIYSIRLPDVLDCAETIAADDAVSKDAKGHSFQDGEDRSGSRRHDPYSDLLLDAQNKPVYYVPEKVSLLDTAQVYRNSGRGCDASNFYDEEVQNPGEMYYSDDEKEKATRQRVKRAGHPDQAIRAQGDLSSRSDWLPRPTGFFAHGAVPAPNFQTGSQASSPQPPEEPESDTIYYDY